MNTGIQNLGWLLGSLFLLFSACQKTPAPEFSRNEAEFIKQERLELKQGETFPVTYRTRVDDLVSILFGTPDDPKIPILFSQEDPASQLFDLDKLQMAAGAVASGREGEPAGLYREHCAQCHGITGDGAGPTAGFLRPYPRDFRMGKFKFKSTPLGVPPTDADLKSVLRNGIQGTGMPSFRLLDDQEIEALVQYVKYLSVRGQYERFLIGQLSDLEESEFVELSDLDAAQLPDWIQEPNAESEQSLDSKSSLVQSLVHDNLIENELLESWLTAEERVSKVPPAPASLVAEHADHTQLVDLGRTLFAGKASCVQCHGANGLGDGQTENYDAWTKDWLSVPGVKLNEPKTHREFLAAGKLKPQTIRPRNLRLPGFRGGGEPETLYRRIRYGIEGTPMPSSSVLTPDEIWALVAYVMQMPYEEGKQIPAIELTPSAK